MNLQYITNPAISQLSDNGMYINKIQYMHDI